MRSNKAPQMKIKEKKILAKKVGEAHRLIKETPITDKERDLVAQYIKKHDADEKKFGYNYEEDFDKIQIALCWKEAEHLEEILFTSLFQLKFKNDKEREEAIRANTHSLKTLSDACKEIQKTEQAGDDMEKRREQRHKKRGQQQPKRRNNDFDDEEDQERPAAEKRRNNRRRSNMDNEDDEDNMQKPRRNNKWNDDNEDDEEDEQPKQRPQRRNRKNGGDDFEDEEENDQQPQKKQNDGKFKFGF